ncbi:hypothetical protein QUA70_13105 [Microcoleus sp. LAD1_D5]|uniref:hypothetical protein n=1 Tax=unclassified Microcoleus TaxID=2642155 RepID=UPI002FD4D6B2
MNCLKYLAGRTLNHYLGIFVNIPGKVRQTKKLCQLSQVLGLTHPTSSAIII